MTRRLMPAPRSDALGAVSRRQAGDAGNDTNAICNYKPDPPASSRIKAILVNLLRHLFELSPVLAAWVGRCVTSWLPWIRRA
jgi:hypothetical protein